MTISVRSAPSLGAICCVLVATVSAQSVPVALPAVAVFSDRVANQQAVGTFTMPVSLLRFEPAVDVQERNFAEGQADIAIRGGTFENTGFRVGGLALYDPQTGHYSAEVPLAPGMLTAPVVLTGGRHAQVGWNATAGTIAYGWAPVQAGGIASIGAGPHHAVRADLYAATAIAARGGQVGIDFAAGYSESDGTIANGDHQFSRAAVRVQYARAGAQTDLVAGRQAKKFGWVNLYTPFNSPESEDIETTLLAFNHRRPQGADGGYFQVSAYHRENYDDYRFNRYAPVGPVLPFEHTTWVYNTAIDGRWVSAGAWSAGYRAGVLTDELKSTSLTSGTFRSRTHLSAGLFPEWRGASGGGTWVVTAGTAVDDTNRDDTEFSPLLEVARERPDRAVNRIHLGYAKTTQVPGYTALNASATAGLFRGNPNLGRSVSHNLETGIRFATAGWEGNAVLFHRRDEALVDWTFQRGVTARLARAMDIDSTGFEAAVRRDFGRADLVLGYAWLHKDADYRVSGGDASFYALNFPEHRLTAAVTVALGAGLELRIDNEARIQRENPLRVDGGDEAWLTAVGLQWRVPGVKGLHLSVHVDNLWGSSYQEVPAVPAAGRQVSFGAAYAW